MIGPAHEGSEVDFFIGNKGKTNKEGKHTTVAMAANVNPIKDFAAMSGVALLHRHVIMKEPFPDQLDYNDFCKRPFYCAARSYTDFVSEHQMSNIWNKAHETNVIFIDKVMHIGR